MVKYIIFLKQNPSKPGRENFNPRDGFVLSSSVLFCSQYHHRPRSANTPLRSSQTFWLLFTSIDMTHISV